MITETSIYCPYCGAGFSTLVDYSAGSQRYIEDCQLCCRPIEFIIDVDYNAELNSITVLRDDD